MAKIKNDETNTLYVIYLPNGEMKRSISTFTVDFMLSKIETKVLLMMQSGKPIEPQELLDLITEARQDMKNLTDPSQKGS